MDNITQGLLGAAVAQAGFRHSLGRRAIFAGILIGLLPDIDVIAGFFGPWAGMVHHRAESHSLIVLPFIAPLIGWIFWRVTHRQNSLKTWTHLAFWALITHPMLDWCTSYGTQLFAPFTNHRFANDAVSIIDPLYTLPLFAATVFGFSGRVGQKSARVAAFGALFISSIYLVWGFNTMRFIQRTARTSLEAKGFQIEDLRVMPTFFNNILWRIVAKDANRTFMVAFFSTSRPMDPIVWHERLTPADKHIEAAMNSELGKLFDWFAMGMTTATKEKTDDGWSVTLEDMRYSSVFTPETGMFKAVVMIDSNDRIISVNPVRHSGRDLKRELWGMWELLKSRASPSNVCIPQDSPETSVISGQNSQIPGSI